MSRRFNTLTSRGLPAYARTALAAFRDLRSERVLISTAGRRETLDILLVAVANSDQYGNNARIAPAPLNLRRAGYLAEIGYRRWQKGEVDHVMTLTAIYPPEV